MNQATNPILLKSRDAARILSISRNQLLHLTKRGKLPVIKSIDGHNRYLLSDLEQWVRAQTAQR